MNFYTGVGSRETPKEVCELFTQIARKLDSLGYHLRSGGADGADTAFEIGATNKTIYLPWKGFNQRFGPEFVVPDQNFALVSLFHPAYKKLSYSGLRLMSRNSYQVLGDDLHTPSNFVLCWTKNGKLKGGTAQAIRVALHHGVQVFNFGGSGKQDFSDYMIRSELFD